MTPASRLLALKAYRLTLKNITGKELAKRIGVESADLASTHALRGRMIADAEALQLTENEYLVMKTLAWLSARQIALASGSVTTPRVDRAAGKRSGWCVGVIKARLRYSGDTQCFGFVVHSHNGHIWLTRAGWAFVWEAKLIKSNWKVPS